MEHSTRRKGLMGEKSQHSSCLYESLQCNEKHRREQAFTNNGIVLRKEKYRCFGGNDRGNPNTDKRWKGDYQGRLPGESEIKLRSEKMSGSKLGKGGMKKISMDKEQYNIENDEKRKHDKFKNLGLLTMAGLRKITGVEVESGGQR